MAHTGPRVTECTVSFPLYGTALQDEDYREPPAGYFGVPARGVRSAAAMS